MQLVFSYLLRVQLQVQRFLQSVPANAASDCALIICLRVHACTICVCCVCLVQLQVQRFLQSMPANAASDCALNICLRMHACTICVCCVCLLRACADVAVATVTVGSPENSPEFPLTLAQPDPDPASQSEEEPVCRPHKSSPTHSHAHAYTAPCTKQAPLVSQDDTYSATESYITFVDKLSQSQSEEEPVCRPHKSSPTYTQPRTYPAPCTKQAPLVSQDDTYSATVGDTSTGTVATVVDTSSGDDTPARQPASSDDSVDLLHGSLNTPRPNRTYCPAPSPNSHSYPLPHNTRAGVKERGRTPARTARAAAIISPTYSPRGPKAFASARELKYGNRVRFSELYVHRSNVIPAKYFTDKNLTPGWGLFLPEHREGMVCVCALPVCMPSYVCMSACRVY